MRAIKSLGIIVLGTLLLTGCGSESQIAKDVEGVLHAPKNYSSTITDTEFTMYYNAASEVIQELFDACLSSASVEVCDKSGSEGSDASVTVSVQLPDVEQYLEGGITDKGYANDVQKLQIAGAAEDEIADYTVKYLTAAIGVGGFPMKSVTDRVLVLDSVIEESDALGPYLASVSKAAQGIAHAEQTDTDSENTEEGESADPDFAKRDYVRAGGAFVYSENSARFLATDIKIVTGIEAEDALKELSPVNDTECGANELYYVEYQVQALTNGSHNTASHFVLTDDDGKIYDNSLTVVGLTDSVCLGGKKSNSAQMSTCLLGPRDAHLVWWTEGEGGVYEVTR